MEEKKVQKIEGYINGHKKASLIIFLVLALLVVAGINQYSKYRKVQQFNAEHPLVNKVYRYDYREKPVDGDWVSATDYYVFGNDKYRNKVVTFSKYNGGIKGAKRILRDKEAYEKEFTNPRKSSEHYKVTDGNKLNIGGDYYHFVKRGNKWVGNYNPEGKNEEKPGEVHKLTPINLK